MLWEKKNKNIKKYIYNNINNDINTNIDNNINNSINHICQNVPVKTAEDMIDGIFKYFEGSLDLIETPYLLIDNKKRCYNYEKNSVQLDEFML